MTDKNQPVAYEPHPVSPTRKKELRAQGFRIIDAVFAPAGYAPQQDSGKAPEAQKRDGLDDLDADALHALAKERGATVHHKAGADKVREALRKAQQ